MVRGAAAAVALFLWAGGVWAKTDWQAFDAKIRAELEAQSSAALAPWDEANAARESDAAKAETLYRKVIELVPRFDHAHRRLCGVLMVVQKTSEAVAECEQALALAASPENKVTLADALLYSPGAQANAPRARQLAEEAMSSGGDKALALQALCQASIAAEDPARLASCAADLSQIEPDGLAAPLYSTIAYMNDGRWAAAATSLETAHRRGLHDDQYAAMKAEIDKHAPAPLPPTVGLAVEIVAVWVGLLALLFLAGAVLSAITLRLADRGPASLAGEATGAEQLLRRVYGTVVRLCGLYFYLSVPLLVVSVPVLAGLVIYGFINVGRIPVKLVLVLVLVACATTWAIVRGLFVRLRDEDPGPRLDLATEPKLAESLERVAGLIGAPRVDHVFMTPGTEVAVFERGGMFRRLARKTERCLILGAGVLDGMTVRQLEAILGHEHGHLRNADTAAGGFAFVVRRSLEQMLIGMMRSGAAAWYNPAWWFLRGFELVFLRVARGAGRLQEILADRWAIVAYGSDAFVHGFEHIVTQTVRFGAQVDGAIRKAVESKEALPNLYGLEAPADGADLDKRIAAALDRQPGPYDSHPAPRQRIAWARALAAPGIAVSSDDSAWSLFADRAGIERRMIEEVRSILAKRGVFLKTEPATPAA